MFQILSAPNLGRKIRIESMERGAYNHHLLNYEKQVDLFINHLGFKESSNDWTAMNSINCLGEWQFAYPTLIKLGYKYITPKKFKRNPSIFPRELQLTVLKQLIEINEYSLRPYDGYIGTTINGIKITKGGLLAGMHLGGLGAIKSFLLSEGYMNRKDRNGTSISDYIKEFSIYNLFRYTTLEDFRNEHYIKFLYNENGIRR